MKPRKLRLDAKTLLPTDNRLALFHSTSQHIIPFTSTNYDVDKCSMHPISDPIEHLALMA
jgi:hypothetical protein